MMIFSITLTIYTVKWYHTVQTKNGLSPMLCLQIYRLKLNDFGHFGDKCLVSCPLVQTTAHFIRLARQANDTVTRVYSQLNPHATSYLNWTIEKKIYTYFK